MTLIDVTMTRRGTITGSAGDDVIKTLAGNDVDCGGGGFEAPMT